MAQFTHSLCEEVIRTEGRCGLTHHEITQMARLALRTLKADAGPLQALLELCEAVGNHPDSMTEGAPLHAAFIKAVGGAQKASPPPEPLRNVIEVPFPPSAASHASPTEEK